MECRETMRPDLARYPRGVYGLRAIKRKLSFSSASCCQAVAASLLPILLLLCRLFFLASSR